MTPLDELELFKAIIYLRDEPSLHLFETVKPIIGCNLFVEQKLDQRRSPLFDALGSTNLMDWFLADWSPLLPIENEHIFDLDRTFAESANSCSLETVDDLRQTLWTAE
jgi:hypothetical protein